MTCPRLAPYNESDRLPARIAIPIILGVSLSGWALFAAVLWFAL